MVVLSVNNLSKNYKSVKALQSVSFSVPEKTVFGILGPNGSGKTTLLGIVMDVLKARWEEGWKCLFYAIDQLTTADLQKEIFIRNSAHTVTEALNRQLAHYAYHVGQIVFIGKMVCNEEWVSLSIPRGGSDAFNKEKFSQPKHKDVQ